MNVDVETVITIVRPRSEVAAFAADPDNAMAWYRNITSVDWRTAKPLAVGSQVTFVARFLGRQLSYTYEVTEWVPGERFVQRTAHGPFPMETTYLWRAASGDATTMSLRNRGTPTGFTGMVAPMMAAAMRRENRKDLQRLKALLESRRPEQSSR